MRIAKRIVGWLVMILGIWFTLYPVGLSLLLIGGRMQGDARAWTDVVGISPSTAIFNSLLSIAIGVGLFLLGRRLARPSRRQPVPPPPDAGDRPSEG